jgi:hypothetical protein
MQSITDYKVVSDWFYIMTAAIIVDTITIINFKTKLVPNDGLFGIKALDDWYRRFGIFAVGADVLSLMIGIGFARYIYTSAGFKGSLSFFLLIVILFQFCHDLFFFLAVIAPMPRGQNEMIDVFKDYAAENGGKILGADALMMIGVALGSMVLKGLPAHINMMTLIITLYSLCFILYTRI